MEREYTRDLIACLPRGKTPFQYFPGRDALWLLQKVVGAGAPIRELRASRFAKLLERPTVRPALAASGDGTLTPSELRRIAWPKDALTYGLTIGRWGCDRGPRLDWSDYQTTRPGWNIVLQMNFDPKHNATYRQYVDDHFLRPFEHSNHPVARGRNLTLAWARIDVDLEAGEALIEEIQSDWLRLVQARLRHFEESPPVGSTTRVQRTRLYYHHVLKPHRDVWDRAMLTAALSFIRDELGVRRIYMHDYDCGIVLKNIVGRMPPKSVYVKLPKTFCFEETQAAPSFLDDNPSYAYRRLRREGGLRFWRLDL